MSLSSDITKVDLTQFKLELSDLHDNKLTSVWPLNRNKNIVLFPQPTASLELVCDDIFYGGSSGILQIFKNGCVSTDITASYLTNQDPILKIWQQFDKRTVSGYPLVLPFLCPSTFIGSVDQKKFNTKIRIQSTNKYDSSVIETIKDVTFDTKWIKNIKTENSILFANNKDTERISWESNGLNNTNIYIQYTNPTSSQLPPTNSLFIKQFSFDINKQLNIERYII